MKILMTGFTPNQCNIMRKKNPLYSGASAVFHALTGQGNSVVNAAPDNVDDVAAYDTVVCGLYSFFSFTAAYGTTLALILADAREKGIPVTFYLDDWHLSAIAGNIRRASENEDAVRRYITLTRKNKENFAYLLSNANKIIDVFAEISRGEFSGKTARVLLPWFQWVENNEPENIFRWPDGTIIRYDPTNLFPVIPVKQVDKARAWVLSSRYDFYKKVKDEMLPSWPIIRYGCKKAGDNLVPNELDLLDAAYAPNWGIISHPYPKKLQGQWRNRFMFSAWCGSIIHATGLEVIPDTCYDYSTSWVERGSDKDLREIAECQAQLYNQWCWSRERASAFVNSVVTKGT